MIIFVLKSPIMKHRIIFLVFIAAIFSFSYYGKAQSIEKDTLIESLKGLSDQQKVNILSSNINRIVFQQPQKAMEYIEIYSQIPLVKTDSVKKCYIYNSKGLCYEMMGDYSKALEYDFKSLKLAKKIKDTVKIAYSNTNIGLVYFYQSHQYEESIKYFKASLFYFTKLGDIKEIAGNYTNIGLAYKMLNNIDSAIYYHYKALNAIKSIPINNADLERRLALVYSNLATDMQIINKLDSSLYYLEKSISLIEKNNMRYELVEVNYSLGFIYDKKGDLEKAIHYTEKALDIAKELGLQAYEMKYYKILAEAYSRQNKYSKAFDYMLMHSNLSDSINSEETRNKLTQLQAKYDDDIKQEQIEKLELNSKVDKLKLKTTIYISIIIILFALAVMIALFIKQKKDKQLAIEKDKVHEKEKLLAASEREKAESIQNELKMEIEYKNKELTSHALNMMKKNKLLQELNLSIDSFRKKANNEQSTELKKIKREINRFLKSDKDWELFKLYFEQVNENFFENLKVINPELSINDMRLCALVKLNMNIKESASVLNIAPNSIKSARYRLRKKLELKPDEDLYEFVQNVGKKR